MKDRFFRVGRLHVAYWHGDITWFCSLRKPACDMDGVSWWLHMGPFTISWRSKNG